MGHAKDNGGVHGHSGLAATEHYIVFAISDDIARNKGFMGWAHAANIAVKPLLGCYKGKTEHSYLTAYKNLGYLLASGWLKRQESILVLGSMDSQDRRKATLHYLTKAGDDLLPRKDELGVLQSVSRDQALQCDAWSYDPAQREYFICIDPNEIKLCPIGLAVAMEKEADYGEYGYPAEHYKTQAADVIKAYLLARRTI